MRNIEYWGSARAFERFTGWVERHGAQGSVNRGASFLGGLAASLAVEISEGRCVTDRGWLETERIVRSTFQRFWCWLFLENRGRQRLGRYGFNRCDGLKYRHFSDWRFLWTVMAQHLLVGTLFGLASLRFLGVARGGVQRPAKGRLFICRFSAPAALLLDDLWFARVGSCGRFGGGCVRFAIGGCNVILEVVDGKGWSRRYGGLL